MRTSGALTCGVWHVPRSHLISTQTHLGQRQGRSSLHQLLDFVASQVGLAVVVAAPGAECGHHAFITGAAS